MKVKFVLLSAPEFADKFTVAFEDVMADGVDPEVWPLPKYVTVYVGTDVHRAKRVVSEVSVIEVVAW